MRTRILGGAIAVAVVVGEGQVAPGDRVEVKPAAIER